MAEKNIFVQGQIQHLPNGVDHCGREVQAYKRGLGIEAEMSPKAEPWWRVVGQNVHSNWKLFFILLQKMGQKLSM